MVQMRWAGIQSEAPATVSHRWPETQRGVGCLVPSAESPTSVCCYRDIRFDSGIALKCWQIRTQRSREILWWLARSGASNGGVGRGSLLSPDRVMRMLAEAEADLGAMC